MEMNLLTQGDALSQAKSREKKIRKQHEKVFVFHNGLYGLKKLDRNEIFEAGTPKTRMVLILSYPK